MHGSDSRWPRAAASGKKSGAQAGRAARRGVLNAGGRDRYSSGQDRNAEEARRRPGVFFGGVQSLRLGQGGSSTHFRPGQPFVFSCSRHLTGTALPDAAVRARQTGACHARPHSRRRGGHSPLVADLRPVCRGRALGRQIGANCWFRSGLRTPSSLWSPTSRFSTRRPRPTRPPTTEASPGTIRRSALLGRRSPGGPVLSDKDRRLPRLKDAPELFE